MPELLEVRKAGFYCPAGDFYIDPWRPVERAVVTHCHSDHARWGCGSYLTSEEGEEVVRARVGEKAQIETLPYGRAIEINNGVRVSLHPAGHILGSAQVRLEYRGRVTVVAGDYKLDDDSTCTSFEPVECNCFVTETTFGLPIFRWPAQEEVFDAINEWWKGNQAEGEASLLFAYAAGKAQRILAGVDSNIGPILTHGAVEKMNESYREGGIELPTTRYAGKIEKEFDFSKSLILAPPSANGTPWMRRFGKVSTGFASGWMQIRGLRRRRSVDRGFVLSDHVDWPGLMTAIDQTGAEEVWATHGYTTQVVRYLEEQGLEARAVETRLRSEEDSG